ncbi:MAG: hypothetical protein CMB37_05110 [Euryarchaeota archaeon]|nr:hypothetical protein [Euryarchaeota archaeon]MED5487289.1 4'-phosphopantetheinyl transferase superfamily protein [Candidatus Thermoplasmatota archaeon]|tara:strand:- start:320 stop:1060 length:741 start_codon:yes stop_codon:yes gene_type:complete
MLIWEPSGVVSPISIPCNDNNIHSGWISVGDFEHNSEIPDISGVPLVDPSEASTFATPKRAYEHAAARHVLATLLHDIGFEADKIAVSRNQYRKPNLVWKDITSSSLNQKLPEISLCHSGGIAIATVSVDAGPIGLDAEPLESMRSRNILSMMSSADEMQHLNDLWDVDEAVAIQETNRIWVIKESVQKACGFGMHLPPQSFAVHEHEDITVNHSGQTYHIQTNHWVETLDDIPFQLGFSKVLGIS